MEKKTNKRCSNFDISSGIDMSGLTNVITSVEEAPIPTIDASELKPDIVKDKKEETIASPIKIEGFQKYLQGKAVKVTWKPITVAQKHLDILAYLKEVSPENLSIRDILYNIIDEVLAKHENEVKKIVKQRKQAELERLQNSLSEYE